MSTAFTAVGSGMSYDPFGLDMANEILIAFQERREVIGQSASLINLAVKEVDAHWSPLTGSSQGRPYWRYYQMLMQEVTRTGFIDWTKTNTGDRTGNWHGLSTDPVTWTESSFLTAAGIPNGFRRATSWDPDTDDWTDYNDAMFSYGYIQPGDIFGPWIYADFQAALSVLDWTWMDSVSGSTFEQRNMDSRYVLSPNDCATAKAWGVAQWPLETWSSEGASLYYAYGYLYQYRWWVHTAQRYRSLSGGTLPSTYLPCAIDVYYRLVGGTIYPEPYQYNDIDGLGVNDNEFYFHETLPAITPAVANRTGLTKFGDYDASPTAGITCYSGAWTTIIKADKMMWILKWDYTHKNP